MQTIKPYSLLIVLLFSTFFSCAQSEESKIKTTCNQFIQGRIALRKGDSLKLKLVTEDSLFRLIMLHQKYANMLKAPVIEADLSMRVKSVTIDKDCASCLMTSYSHYEIKLCKEGDHWKVKGENDIYATSERINKARQKIIDYKEELKRRPAVDSILKVVNKFLPSVKAYFKTQNLDKLKPICNEATLHFIQRLYSYSKERTGLELLHDEMDKPNFMVGDGVFETDRTLFKFYNEDIFIVLKKHNNNYIITGFNKMNSDTIDTTIMEAQYLDLLRSMKLIRQPRYRNKELK
ncbi:hypothetical protein [Psychroserpens sp. MEBiC05023]